MPRTKKWTVYLMSPYLSFEGVKAKTKEEAIAQCPWPFEIDLNEPWVWHAVEEKKDGT